MRGLIASYERNHLRVVAGLVVVLLLSLTTFLGYAKGSPRFFDGNPGLKLIRRDGTTVAQWTARVYDLPAEQAHEAGFPKSNWNIDLHGSCIGPDGSVLFNFEVQALMNLTRCGEIDWSLSARTHHTVEPAAAGGYWVGGRRVRQQADDPSYYPVVNSHRSRGRIADDLVLRVNQQGKTVEAKSLFDILMDNGFEPVLTAIGTSLDDTTLEDNEVLHLNKIVELGADLAPAFPDFAAGDLLISVRDYNLVRVVAPGTWRVKWHSVHPRT